MRIETGIVRVGKSERKRLREKERERERGSERLRERGGGRKRKREREIVIEGMSKLSSVLYQSTRVCQMKR